MHADIMLARQYIFGLERYKCGCIGAAQTNLP
jgi:hypothetical protein